MLRTYRWSGKRGTVNARDPFGRTLPTSLSSARACSTRDLAMEPQLGAAGGQVGASLDVHNTSSSPCELAGAPRLAMIDDAGVVWRSSSPSDPAGRGAKPVVLLPNSWATLSPLWIGSSCAGFGLTTKLRVTLASGSTRTLAWRVGSNAPDSCLRPGEHDHRVPDPGQMGRPAFTAVPEGRETNLDDLPAGERTIQLLVPASAQRGSVLRYTVRVSPNDSAGTSVWDPTCPLFRQTLIRTGPTYELNCEPSQVFLGNKDDAVDFDMQVPVPADAPLGPTTLSWQLVEPDQAPVTATVTIVG